MKIIVGLGNPGKEYANTRHNIGWYCLDKFLGDVDWTKKFNAAIYETNINGEKYIFVKPLTYMNLSGNAVGEIVNFYKKGGKDKKTPEEVWKILNNNPNFDDGFIDEPEYDDDLTYKSLPDSVKSKISEEEWENFLDDLFDMSSLVEEAKKQNPRFI